MKVTKGLNSPERRWLGMIPLFDPADGTTILAPDGEGVGHWKGACSAVYDDEAGKFYLYYRVRSPRPIRGGECRIAESTDGIGFTDIWSATKEDFETTSIERSALIKCLDGKWRLYVSYVDPKDNRWRTDMLEAEHPRNFTPKNRKKIFTADDIDGEGVKDPYVIIVGGLYYMILSYATKPIFQDEDKLGVMHDTADVYNTGVCKSSTGLGISHDGVNFTWLGDIFAPGDSGWDSYASRIGTVVYTPPVFTALYDGSIDVSENYEEKTGLAISYNLKDFQRITPEGPALTSPYGSGSLRYVDVVAFKDELFYYYEMARPDGSHELRLNRVKR
ncbi:MAG: hypothetical protein GX316_11040 [Firmicutes bacterium]|nr:hypothetical protein [Bacillota bacterium]